MAKFYEEIIVDLVSDHEKSRKDLHELLVRLGYIPYDHFYDWMRNDKVEEWQLDHLFRIHCYNKNKEIYTTVEDIEEIRDEAVVTGEDISIDWDKLKINYLLASLPEELIDVFLDKVYYLKDILDVKLLYEGKEISKADLRDEMFRMAKEMEEKYAPVGSDSLDTLMSLEHQGVIILD